MLNKKDDPSSHAPVHPPTVTCLGPMCIGQIASGGSHLRVVDSRGKNLGGLSLPRPRALCGATIAWDTNIPIGGNDCERCARVLNGSDPRKDLEEHSPKTRSEIDARISVLDVAISEADGDSGFNEPFLLEMQEAGVLDAYHESETATDDDRMNLMVAMTKFCKENEILILD